MAYDGFYIAGGIKNPVCYQFQDDQKMFFAMHFSTVLILFYCFFSINSIHFVCCILFSNQTNISLAF